MALQWPQNSRLPLGGIHKAEKKYLRLQPLSVSQELCCSFRNCRQSQHQPPASTLSYAKCKTSGQTH